MEEVVDLGNAYLLDCNITATHKPSSSSKIAKHQGVNQRISVKMSGGFYNSNGFQDPKKHKFVNDLTKENNLNFIAVSKTRRSDFTPRFFRNLCVGRDYLWHSKPPKGRSAVMLLGVDLQIF
jgi:hypothetical protein